MAASKTTERFPPLLPLLLDFLLFVLFLLSSATSVEEVSVATSTEARTVLRGPAAAASIAASTMARTDRHVISSSISAKNFSFAEAMHRMIAPLLCKIDSSRRG